MPANNFEYYLLMPYIVIGVGIVLSVVLEISTKKSKELLPWFSALLFFGTAIYSIFNVDQGLVQWDVRSWR